MAMAMSPCFCSSSSRSTQISSARLRARRCDVAAVNLCVSKSGSDLFRKGLLCKVLKQSVSISRFSGNGTQSARFIVRATISAEEAPAREDLSKLKADLLAVVAGLDRGLVAVEADEFAANAAAQKLEAVADAVQLPEDLDKFDGKWRLVFSSGFNSGSYGGQRPGPSISRSPFTLGTVYQTIDVAGRELDNIVDLIFPVPWPLPPFEITATLGHSFELAGGSKIKILFEKTSLKLLGALSRVPKFDLPKLPEFLRTRNDVNGPRSGEFETTYLDSDFRISRGDRGELRIFVKV